MTDHANEIDLSTPRTVGQILDAAFRIYARRPLLFMFLTGIVLVPYGVVAVLVSQAKHVSAATEFILVLADLALVNPFIATLEMQALIDLGAGRRPRIRDVITRSLKVVAVVAAADIVAGLCHQDLGLFMLMVPVCAACWCGSRWQLPSPRPSMSAGRTRSAAACNSPEGTSGACSGSS